MLYNKVMNKKSNRQNGFGIVGVILVVFVLLVLAGGGWYLSQRQKPAPAPTTTSSFKKVGYDDACALVGKADVEAAFNMQFEEFAEDTGPGTAGLSEISSRCTINEVHERTAKGAIEFTSLQIVVDKFDSKEVASHKLDVMRRSVVIDGKKLDEITEVSGLGDEALFSKNRGFGLTQEWLFVRKGERLFSFIALKLNGIDSEKVRPPMLEIAKKAVE